MADHAKLEDLVAAVLGEMRRPEYSEQTITGFRRFDDAFVRFARERGEEAFSEETAVASPSGKFGVESGRLHRSNPRGGTYLRHGLRCMRTLMGYQGCGCMCKRMPGEPKGTPLPQGPRDLPGSLGGASRRAGHSESTVCSRDGRARHFLPLMAERGGVDASCLGDSSAHDYMLTKSSNHAKSVRSILAAIRCLHRHTCLEGLVGRDLTGTVPSPRPCHSPELPDTWSREDVTALVGGIDRGNPAGRRDYAMLLMVARLGLRASDVKSVRMSGFDWEDRALSMARHKTGVAPGLPLPGDVGWAVIDYPGYGRPKGATCPEPLVRQVAPLDRSPTRAT